MTPDHTAPDTRYSVASTLLENVPYALMILLGVAALLLSLYPGRATWGVGGGYLAYGLLGPLWIILFLCPHCPSFGKRSCPCGYGVLSARLRRPGDTSRFGAEFKRHIGVIVPLWLIPPIVAGVTLARGFSWPLAVVLGVFVLNSYVLLPLRSKLRGCKHCGQRAQCPWAR